MIPLCIAPKRRKKPAKAGLFDVKFVKQIFQSEAIAVMAQPANDPDGQIGKIRVVSKSFARMHVGQMHLDKRNGHAGKRIT